MAHLGKLAAAVILAVTTVGIAPTPADARTTWRLIDCAETDFANARICFYFATGHQAQGRFINESPFNIDNQGVFLGLSGGPTKACGRVVTKAHTTATCTRTMPANSIYRLRDEYYDEHLHSQIVETKEYRFVS